MTWWSDARGSSTDGSNDLPPGLESALAALRESGATVVAVGWDGQARGLLAVADS